MKIYNVIDNCDSVKVTADRIVMLESLYRLYKKYKDKQSWYWVEEDSI